MNKKIFLLASSNRHKACEFEEFFSGSSICIESAPKKIEVNEDGDSFTQNSHKKAWAYYKEFTRPILSDDSGLIVEDLPHELGVHSARFGGHGLTDRERALLLLEKLASFNNHEITRRAYFVCVLTFILSDKEIYSFEGRLEGIIGQEYRGEQGFGYDPIFIPKNGPSDKNGRPLTLAECHDWKGQNSHRAKACFDAKNFFV